MRPRLEWLETFLAIVETGSLTQAADQIARSQSAVSLQMRQLEQLIGAQLLRRQGRGVAVTPVGEKLVPLAQRAVDAAGAAAAVAGEHERRLIRTGVPEEYADWLVPGLLEDLTGRDPGLALEVQCASSAILEHRVRRGQLDLAFALAEEVEGAGLPVATDPVAWLQAPGAGVMQQRPLPVALFDQACSWRNRALEALDGFDFEVVFTSASVAGVRAGILSGLAVGVLADATAGSALERIQGPSAPPALPPAELVLLPGTSSDREVALFTSGARNQFRRIGQGR